MPNNELDQPCDCPLCKMGYKSHQMRVLREINKKTGKETGKLVRVSEAVYQQLQSMSKEK